MRSGPEALFSKWFVNCLKTPSSVTVISVISGNSGFPGSGMEPSSWLNTDWYCQFRISALFFGSDMRSPFSLRGTVPVRSFEISRFQNLFCVFAKFWPSLSFNIFFSMFPVCFLNS